MLHNIPEKHRSRIPSVPFPEAFDLLLDWLQQSFSFCLQHFSLFLGPLAILLRRPQIADVVRK